MGWYKNYESKYKKNANINDMARRPRRQVKKNKEYLTFEEKKERLIRWNTFFRRNIHIFIDWYLGLELHLFQKITLYLMSIHPSFMVVASRGVSKSFMVAVFSVAMAILKPNSMIIIGSSTKKQATIIVKEKIKKELLRYPNIAREISDIRVAHGEGSVDFHNGSSIIVVCANDGARGNRATLNIYEEFRLIPKNILDSVFSPFLISRQCPYLRNPEYEHLSEEPQEIYISSAWYKNGHYMWDLICEHSRSMLNDFESKELGILSFDYLLSIHHRLKTKKLMDKEKKKSDNVTFMLEYENIMFGEAKDAFFKYDMFRRNQRIKKAFYPRNNIDFASKNKNPYDISKKDGEIRLVSVDISAISGDRNDNSVITCMRLLPSIEGYERQVPYIESFNGGTSTVQSLRIKQIFSDFNADYIVLDYRNIGTFLYDELGKIIFDEERNVEYPSYVYNKYTIETEDLIKRTNNKNGLPVIYCINASAASNSEMALQLRDSLQKEKIKFLIDTTEAEKFLTKSIKEYKNTEDADVTNLFEMPYVETILAINETVNLEYKMISGNIKMYEHSNARKDRYTSISYGNYFASILEKDLTEEDSSYDFVFSFS